MRALDPAFRPDGQLTYLMFDVTTKTYALFTSTPSSRNATLLLHIPGNSTYHSHIWSPDGTRVALVEASSPEQVLILSSSGSLTTRIPGDALYTQVDALACFGITYFARELNAWHGFGWPVGFWAAAQGAAYLDGAIMATPDFIGTEAGTILFAGSSQAFEANKPVFLALGGNVQHVGEDAGLANALDSALLGLMWGALFGTLNAIAVCQAEGVALGMLGRLWQTLVPVIDG